MMRTFSALPILLPTCLLYINIVGAMARPYRTPGTCETIRVVARWRVVTVEGQAETGLTQEEVV